MGKREDRIIRNYFRVVFVAFFLMAIINTETSVTWLLNYFPEPLIKNTVLILMIIGTSPIWGVVATIGLICIYGIYSLFFGAYD